MINKALWLKINKLCYIQYDQIASFEILKKSEDVYCIYVFSKNQARYLLEFEDKFEFSTEEHAEAVLDKFMNKLSLIVNSNHGVV